MVEAAERVRDPVRATMAYEQHARVAEVAAALRADAEREAVVAGGDDSPGLPMGAVDDPRDHMLETAEDRPPITLRLGRAEA